MSQEVLTKFIHLVFSDARLQEQLREITDRNDFIERVVRLGKEFDLEFTANDVSNALQMGRRAWLERGIG
jgi:glutamate-1-semialdehyde aminotransferase